METKWSICYICGKPSKIQLSFSNGDIVEYCNEHGIPEARRQFQRAWKEMQ